MLDHPLVYALVLNYCSLNDTLECVDSLHQVNYPAFRILVLDNASPKNEGAVLKQKLPNEEFIQLPKNIGYAGGNNIGIRLAMEAGADYIFILNPDVRITPESITCYIKILEEDSTIGALNPIQVYSDGYTIDSKFCLGIFKNHELSIPDLKSECTEQWEVNTLYGAALMLPATTIKIVGGFDPLYFAYGEEEDFCRRIKYHDLRLVVTGKEPVIHLRTKEKNQVDDFRLFLRLKGSYLLRIKNPTEPFYKSLKNVAKDISKALFGLTKDAYPFNLYPISLRHVIKSGIWLACHLHKAYWHRQKEKLGRCHI